jgi:hypothetical protein
VLLNRYIQSVGEPWQNRRVTREFVRHISALIANVASDP